MNGVAGELPKLERAGADRSSSRNDVKQLRNGKSCGPLSVD